MIARKKIPFSISSFVGYNHCLGLQWADKKNTIMNIVLSKHGLSCCQMTAY